MVFSQLKGTKRTLSKRANKEVGDFHKVYIAEPYNAVKEETVESLDNIINEVDNAGNTEPRDLLRGLNEASVARGDISVNDFLMKLSTELDANNLEPAKRMKLNSNGIDEKIETIFKQNSAIIKILKKLDDKITGTNDELKRISKICDGLAREHLSLNLKIRDIVAAQPIPKKIESQAVVFDHFLPVKTTEEIDELEQRLSDEKFYAAFVQHIISRIETNEFIKTVRTALSSIFSPEFGVYCNWSGVNSKIAVNDLKCINAIKDVLDKKEITSTKECVTFESVVQTWFHHSNDRLKYHLKANPIQEVDPDPYWN